MNRSSCASGSGNVPWIFQHYMHLAGPLDPGLVTQAMAKYGAWGNPLAVDVPGLDYAFLDDSRAGMVELCICKDRRILFVQYLGHASDVQDVLRLAQQALTTS